MQSADPQRRLDGPLAARCARPGVAAGVRAPTCGGRRPRECAYVCVAPVQLCVCVCVCVCDRRATVYGQHLAAPLKDANLQVFG